VILSLAVAGAAAGVGIVIARWRQRASKGLESYARAREAMARITAAELRVME
jgi:NADH:ubiquinone oxidoreductase subunit K